jgi:hypothetical protein
MPLILLSKINLFKIKLGINEEDYIETKPIPKANK